VAQLSGVLFVAFGLIDTSVGAPAHRGEVIDPAWRPTPGTSACSTSPTPGSPWAALRWPRVWPRVRPVPSLAGCRGSAS
jgi:hypothetical protein